MNVTRKDTKRDRRFATNLRTSKKHATNWTSMGNHCKTVDKSWTLGNKLRSHMFLEEHRNSLAVIDKTLNNSHATFENIGKSSMILETHWYHKRSLTDHSKPMEIIENHSRSSKTNGNLRGHCDTTKMFESHRKSTEIWKSREKGVKTQWEPQISIRTIIVNHWQIIENNKNSLNIIWKNMKITKARQQPHISTFSGTHWPSPREATSQRGESSYLFKSEPKQHECARCIEHLCDLFENDTPWMLRGLEPNQSWWSVGEPLSFREIQLF